MIRLRAMTLGDRICVMNVGVIEQVGDPRTIFDYPATMFVARFIGTPPMNLFEGELKEKEGKFVFTSGSFSCVLPEHMQKLLREKTHDSKVTLGVRPRAFTLKEAATSETKNDASITGCPGISEMLGEEILIHVEIDQQSFIASVEPKYEEILVENDEVEFCLDMELAHIFDNKTGRNLTIPPEISQRTTLWSERIRERSIRRRKQSEAAKV